MKKTLIIITSIVLLIVIGIGIKIGVDKHMKNEQEKEMTEIVHSEEVKRIFEDSLKKLDGNALTDQGIIKKYQVNNETIKANPMGGINGQIYVNDDKNLTIDFNLDKDSSGNFDSDIVSSIAGKLSNKLELKRSE
ncbi:DUF1310 family protein [Listeria valentina]|uniref:DUF1310 family protein n=1 Tax=Listeria valentina TaxID=2705293 RepID=UPI001430FFCD|nr:DUF1310 family protein [Listeria valentina]